MENNCGTTYAIPLRLGPSFAQCPVASSPACSPAEFAKGNQVIFVFPHASALVASVTPPAGSEEVCTATPAPQLTLANTPKFGTSPTSHLSTDPKHLPALPPPAVPSSRIQHEASLRARQRRAAGCSPAESSSSRIRHTASLRARQRPAAGSQSETTASTSPASALIRPQRYGPSRSLRQITLPAFK